MIIQEDFESIGGGEEPSPNAAYMQTVNITSDGVATIVDLEVEPTFLRVANYLNGNNHNGCYVYENGTWITPTYIFSSIQLSEKKLTIVGNIYSAGKYDVCYK